ncbi:MAG: hypothetical protein H0X66_05470 [Verrucomicrobia bacterium]|nr:hypothetical protein [Verrucomicrobiota bacterium]
MDLSLKTFKQRYQERLLKFLWEQWSALGVAGEIGAEDNRIIDPEALLLFTCVVGRHDPRLFDEVLDWLQENGQFISVTRLKRIAQKESSKGIRSLGAIAALLAKGTEMPKWKQLAETIGPLDQPEPFFYNEAGEPIAVLREPEPHFARFGYHRGPLRLRGYSQKFQPTERTNLVLQLRALLGMNVRCEIVAYLLTHEAAHPSQIAREVYYFDRGVQSTLVDMLASGIVQLQTFGREKRYGLKRELWLTLLSQAEPAPKWMTWPPLFSALERVWLRLNDPKLLELDPLLQSSELRQLMVENRPSIERAGLGMDLSDDRQFLGESYLPVFIADMTRLVQKL